MDSLKPKEDGKKDLIQTANYVLFYRQEGNEASKASDIFEEIEDIEEFVKDKEDDVFPVVSTTVRELGGVVTIESLAHLPPTEDIVIVKDC